MILAPMRYKDYIWPHNPRVYSIEYERTMSSQKVPYGYYHLQDLGVARRIMRGEGEFVGPDAYAEFKKLASVFYSSGPGILVHPVWQISSAYFVELSLAQEPREDYVRYTFAFWEDFDGYEKAPKPVPALPEYQPEPETPDSAPAEESTAMPQTPWPILNTVISRQPARAQQWHTVNLGETIWDLAERYEVPASELIRMNPQIRNPNELKEGERVRVR